MVTNADGVDGRADIYALGCVAYWLLSGHAPFERDTVMATILAHVNEAPTPPSRVSELEIPAPLDALVLECLAKRPGDRPATAAELSSRLDAAGCSEGWTQERAERWWKAHRPTREATPPGLGPEATVKVTKVLP
jgi:serine/threonine-protein kinase